MKYVILVKLKRNFLFNVFSNNRCLDEKETLGECRRLKRGKYPSLEEEKEAPLGVWHIGVNI